MLYFMCYFMMPPRGTSYSTNKKIHGMNSDCEHIYVVLFCFFNISMVHLALCSCLYENVSKRDGYSYICWYVCQLAK